MELKVLTLGAAICSLKVPDRNGNLVEVIVGLASENDYYNETYVATRACLGATIGRFAGRIADGHFVLDGQTFNLETQHGVHLHGGSSGFDRQPWQVLKTARGKNPFVELRYKSVHMESGYPGTLEMHAKYCLTEANELIISYEGTSDRNTIVNITNHAYFNLNGSGDILGHSMRLHSDKRLETDSRLVPTGTIVPVEGTAFDFQQPRRIGHEGFCGLDDTFLLNRDAAQLTIQSDTSGIVMEVTTNQPAAVIYTPRSLSHLAIPKQYKDTLYPAFCVETQNFPDAPNHSHFPSANLKAGEHYLNTSTFAFTVRP